MKFRAVIFDLDGTLADTLEDIADNMNYVLVDNGFPQHEYESYRYYVGGGLKNLVARCLPQNVRTDAVIDKCHKQMLSCYNANYINKTRLYDGIAELLDALSAKSIRMAVLSNKADMLTQKICNVLLKTWTFDAVVGASDSFPQKPDPASALFVAQQMLVPPADVLYLGDSDIDMKTAISAGFYPVGAGWGFRPEKELIENGANIIIKHPRECSYLF